MTFHDRSSYYDLLEISPDATPQEIRTAYLRVKSAYKKDSPALYTLMDEMDTGALLEEIENAYLILSHPEKRKEYDRSHGILRVDMEDPRESFAASPPTRSPSAPLAKVVSIDRVPPMEDSRHHPEILVAPKTDFSSAPPIGASDASAAAQLLDEIAAETEWKGTTLRRVRENKRIALEELAEYTKISKTYLIAIEEENFAKLPAPVFLRGFVIQISKFLKLPADAVAAAYMARRNAFEKKQP